MLVDLRCEGEVKLSPGAETQETLEAARPEPQEGRHYGPGAIVTVPNLITFGRAAALPLLFYLMLQEGSQPAWAAFVLWIVLGVSDSLDGILARKLGPTSSGAYLDPLADKLQVIGALTILMVHDKISWVPLALVVGREIVVSGIRTLAARRGVSVPATPFGKAKTVSQMVAVGLFIFPLLENTPGPAEVVLWVAVGFTLASGLDYLWRAGQIFSRPQADVPPPDSGSLDEALDPLLSALLDREGRERSGGRDRRASSRGPGGCGNEPAAGLQDARSGQRVVPLRAESRQRGQGVSE